MHSELEGRRGTYCWRGLRRKRGEASEAKSADKVETTSRPASIFALAADPLSLSPWLVQSRRPLARVAYSRDSHPLEPQQGAEADAVLLVSLELTPPLLSIAHAARPFPALCCARRPGYIAGAITDPLALPDQAAAPPGRTLARPVTPFGPLQGAVITKECARRTDEPPVRRVQLLRRVSSRLERSERRERRLWARSDPYRAKAGTQA